MRRLPEGFSQQGSVVIYIFLAIILIGFSVFGTYFAISNKLISLPGLSQPTLVQAPPPEAPKDYKLKGVLALKEGSVAIKKGPQTWEEISKGATISEGDVIKTGYKARAVVELDDGSAVRLDQRSEVSFSSLSGQVILLTQDNGRVYHRVNPGRLVYNVKSLDTVATALGTSFSIKTDALQKTTEVAVYESKVAVSSGPEGSKTQVASGEIAKIGQDEKVEVGQITEEEKKEAFIAWNQTLDKEPVSTITPTASSQASTPVSTAKVSESSKTEAKKDETITASGLTLSAQAKDGAVDLSWSVTGSAPKGFKVIKSTNPNPEYPVRSGDSAQYLSSDARSYTWSGLTSGTTYYFRVGVFNGSDVSLYSNNVSAVVPTGNGTTTSSSGSTEAPILSAVSSESGKVNVSWVISDSQTKAGFKVCLSENANPSYPAKSPDRCDYINNNNARSYEVKELTSGRTYHFRVGVYDNGVSVYSNDITVTVK